MSGKGLAANVPPDPYLEGASSYLISPIFDLAAYREVFVELWFWARFEDPVDAPRRVHDFGRVLLYDVAKRSTSTSIRSPPSDRRGTSPGVPARIADGAS